ncbi:MAG: hypothetical protein CM15mP93_13530 [Thiotrichaceae bacterium]|nr:MAG: hypothetical protein CM15mP93_13530 [Thiotrichaceae bacterium]
MLQWIDSNLKNISLVNTSSNAEAAKFVQKEKMQHASQVKKLVRYIN